LAPPPVGPYQPKDHPDLPPDWQQQIEDFDVIAELGPENLSAGTKRLVRDVEAGSVPGAQATRIALAKMGYLDLRMVPERYRGEVSQSDYYALTYVAEQAGLELSDAEAEQLAAEVDAYTYGAPTP
jgi:hypothetical protein